MQNKDRRNRNIQQVTFNFPRVTYVYITKLDPFPAIPRLSLQVLFFLFAMYLLKTFLSKGSLGKAGVAISSRQKTRTTKKITVSAKGLGTIPLILEFVFFCI